MSTRSLAISLSPAAVVSFIVALATMAIGQGLSWLVPTAPRWVATACFAGGLTLLIGVAVWNAKPWRTVPSPPWFPDQPLAFARWLKQRPVVSPLGPVLPAVRWEIGRMEDCRLIITLFHGIDRAPAEVSILYEGAVLTVEQTVGGRLRRFTFRPHDVGGLLAQPTYHTDLNKAVQLAFVWTGLPARNDCAPDLQAGFDWTLSGIRAVIHGEREMTGRLPAIRRQAMSTAQLAELSRHMPPPAATSAMI